MSPLTPNVIPLAILILGLAVWFLIRRFRYIKDDKDQLDKRLRDICR